MKIKEIQIRLFSPDYPVHGFLKWYKVLWYDRTTFKIVMDGKYRMIHIDQVLAYKPYKENKMENREYKQGDDFVLHSSNGKDYHCTIVNINEYREPSMKYLIDSEVDGHYVDEAFVGDSFFENNSGKIEFIERREK